MEIKYNETCFLFIEILFVISIIFNSLNLQFFVIRIRWKNYLYRLYYYE